LIEEKRFRPAEGKKEDEAHPAIFPTGIIPKSLENDEEKVYDLIVKRFLACFAEYATIEKTEIILDSNGELYRANGEVIKKEGWLRFYAPYVEVKNKAMPELNEGERIKIDRVFEKELKTMPPKRFTKASLISLLEKKNLGTKATRAEIIRHALQEKLYRGEQYKGN